MYISLNKILACIMKYNEGIKNFDFFCRNKYQSIKKINFNYFAYTTIFVL